MEVPAGLFVAAAEWRGARCGSHRVPCEAEKQFSQTKGYRWRCMFSAINANDLNSFHWEEKRRKKIKAKDVADQGIQL